MNQTFRPRTLVLFVGDLLSFVVALWGALFLRAGTLPTAEIFWAHMAPFSVLFVVWAGVFLIAGLYENRSVILARRALSTTLLIAQSFNMALAALFFFFVPLFGIAPKTILFIYLGVSFVLMLLWRVVLFPRLYSPERAIVVGEGEEVAALVDAMAHAHRGPARVAGVLSPAESNLAQHIVEEVRRHGARAIIADWRDNRVAAAFPDPARFLQGGVRFFDAGALYQEVFGRIPLGDIDSRWIAKNIPSGTKIYDTLKRVMDILIALPLFALSLVVYPFVALALKFEDRGEVVISMPRVGKGERIFNLYKFRSMSGNDKGEWKGGATKLHVTKVGKFLRDTRLDELPQLWNVLQGDLSLIGPRPEFPAAVAAYEEAIPYYNLRHLITPGLSGWAQLYGEHAHHGVGLEETRNKLSHDLYYLKRRSLALDVTIALKTIKKLLTRSGV